MYLRRTLSLLVCLAALELCAETNPPSRTQGGASPVVEPKGNLHAVLNAFIAAIAKDHPEYKASIIPLQPNQPAPPGFQQGYSTTIGPYAFRPKNWPELSPSEQASLLDHPRLKAFIISLRNERIYPALSTANADANVQPGWIRIEGERDVPYGYRVRVSAEELIRNRTTVIPVQRVPQGAP